MWDFLLNTILWTLAIYGMIEIIKNIIYICSFTKIHSDGIYLIIAVKNQENIIEGFMRSFLFRLIYGKEELIKEVIVADLDSDDHTVDILRKMEKDQEMLKVTNWKDCKEVIENVKAN